MFWDQFLKDEYFISLIVARIALLAKYFFVDWILIVSWTFNAY